MSSEQTASTTQQELVRTEARANLLVALYAHVTHECDRVREERDQARVELAQARSEIERLGNELGQSAARATELRQRHAAFLDSTSWRVTAPLRALGRLFKRGS